MIARAAGNVAKIQKADPRRRFLDTGATVTIEGVTYSDYVAIGLAYARLVDDGKIPACRYIKLAVGRFLQMYRDALTGEAEFYWSTEHAVEPCAFIERLTHIKGDMAKQRITLEPWQIWVLIAIYGFRWSDTGKRVVTIVMLEVPRKNGKSLFSAGIGLYEATANAFAGDDVYIIAPTQAQADKVLEPMVKMVGNDPDLSNYYQIATTQAQINIGLTDSYVKTLSSNGKHQDGHDPKVVIADEFHKLPPAIFTVMKSSQGARSESLFIEIGSAGTDVFGVGWDERNRCIDILEGKKHDLNIFAAIYTIDNDDFGNWRSERVIRKANPNFEVSLDRRKVFQEVDEIFTNARNKNETLRTRFNVWGLGESKLIGHDAWMECAIATKISDFHGQDCWIGVDLASRNDMVTYAMEFLKDGVPYFFARHFVPSMGPWREDEEVRDIYQQWADAGHLVLTDGSHHSYDDIIAEIVGLSGKFNIKACVVDDQEANTLMAALTKRGVTTVAMRKNASNYSAPTKDLMARANGKIKAVHHDGNPVLAWNVENVIGGYNTAEMILPKKVDPHSNMKIDGFDCMVMAHAVVLEQVDLSSIKKPNPMAVRGVRQIDV